MSIVGIIRIVLKLALMQFKIRSSLMHFLKPVSDQESFKKLILSYGILEETALARDEGIVQQLTSLVT